MGATDTAVKDQTPRDQYTATSNQTTFDYNFLIFDKEDLVVKETTNPGTSSESTSTLTQGTDYTVSGVGDEDGGSITLTSGANKGDYYTLVRKTTIERLTDFLKSGEYKAENINLDLDTIFLILLERQLDISRAATLKEETNITSIELPSPSAGAAIGWNMSEDGLTNVSNNIYTEDVSLSGGSPVTINHQLNQKYVIVQFYDNNDNQATLDKIQLTDKNNLDVESSVSVSGTVVVSR